MPEQDQTPELDHWVTSVYKHLQWQLPDATPIEAEAPLTPQQECKKLADRLLKLDKGSRAVVNKGDHLLNDDYEKRFWAVGERLFKTVQEAKKLHATLAKEEAPDTTELKTLLATVETASKEMEAVAQENFAEAAALIKSELAPGVESFRTTIQNTADQRAPLAKWGIDLTQFDKTHEAATDLLTQMITAINGNDYNRLKDLLTKSKPCADVFTTAAQQAATEPERIKTEARQRLNQITADITNLSNRAPKPENNPDLQSLIEQIQQTTQKAQKSLEAEDGTALTTHLSQSEHLLHQLKQAWLTTQSTPQTQDTTGTLRQIEELKAKLDAAHQQLQAIRAGSPDSPAFESTLTNAQKALQQAQNHLLANNTSEAETTLATTRHHTETLDHLLAQLPERKSQLTQQLAQVTQQAAPWIARLPICEGLFEFGKPAAKYYHQFHREIIIFQRGTALAEKYLDEGSLLLAQETIETAETNLTQLTIRAQAALDHLKLLENPDLTTERS